MGIILDNEKNKAISVEFPLNGEWKFLRPPGHHEFAFDFVKVVKGKMHSKNPINSLIGSTSSKDYFCWQEPVSSPISGIVLQCANDWPDHDKNNLIKTIKRWYNATYKFKPEKRNGFIDIRPNAGNYLMIKSDDDFIVFLAHLKQHSLTVKIGDEIEVGQKLAEVGNSGNSTAPHLHMNLFDQMDDPIKAEVLPFVFRTYQERKNDGAWHNCNSSIPKVKSIISRTKQTIK